MKLFCKHDWFYEGIDNQHKLWVCHKCGKIIDKPVPTYSNSYKRMTNSFKIFKNNLAIKFLQFTKKVTYNEQADNWIENYEKWDTLIILIKIENDILRKEF